MNHEMNPEKSESMTPSEINQYFKEFLLALDRKVQFISGFRLAEAADYKQYCALWLLERGHLMNDYAPRALASVCRSEALPKKIAPKPLSLKLRMQFWLSWLKVEASLTTSWTFQMKSPLEPFAALVFLVFLSYYIKNSPSASFLIIN